jgi:hypothetical protein
MALGTWIVWLSACAAERGEEGGVREDVGEAEQAAVTDHCAQAAADGVFESEAQCVAFQRAAYNCCFRSCIQPQIPAAAGSASCAAMRKSAPAAGASCPAWLEAERSRQCQFDGACDADNLGKDTLAHEPGLSCVTARP